MVIKKHRLVILKEAEIVFVGWEEGLGQEGNERKKLKEEHLHNI